MIRQNIGLDYLVPLAIQHLNENPLLRGDGYPGDLLTNTLSIRDKFWDEHVDLKQEIDEIVLSAIKKLESLSEEDVVFCDAVRKAIRHYQSTPD
jgi:hypothetical protein